MWRRRKPIPTNHNTVNVTNAIQTVSKEEEENEYRSEDTDRKAKALPLSLSSLSLLSLTHDDDNNNNSNNDEHHCLSPNKSFFRSKSIACKMRVRAVLIVLSVIILSARTFPLVMKLNQLEINLNSTTESSLDAIVTVAMCGFQAIEMVQSLRTIGNWKGPIYVITDTPIMEQEYDHAHPHAYAHAHPDASPPLLNDSLYTEINVRGNHPIFDTQHEFDQYVQGIHRFKATIYSKWHKTQIFNLIPPQDNINNVLFMDADMLAQKSIMDHWLPSIEDLWNHPHRGQGSTTTSSTSSASTVVTVVTVATGQDDNHCPISLYPERWYTSLPIIGKHDITLSGKYNSGMMLLNRHASQSLLEKWGDALVRPPFVGRDQGKLTQVLEEMGTRVCFLPNHWVHVQNEADVIDRIWFKMFGKGTFLHISSAKTRQTKKYQRWNHQLMQECNYTNLVFPSSTNITTTTTTTVNVNDIQYVP